MEPIAALIVLALYLLPMVIATHRDHHQKSAITALNVLLGWSVIGWIAAFVWSLTAVHRDLSDAARGVSREEYREISKHHLMPWKEARRRATR